MSTVRDRSAWVLVKLFGRRRRGTLIVPFGLFAIVALILILLIDFLRCGGLAC